MTPKMLSRQRANTPSQMPNLWASAALAAARAALSASISSSAAVALRALLFAVSDLLIFARLGPLAVSIVPTLLVWPLYVAGQAMIAYGVVRTERAGNEGVHDRL